MLELEDATTSYKDFEVAYKEFEVLCCTRFNLSLSSFNIVCFSLALFI